MPDTPGDSAAPDDNGTSSTPDNSELENLELGKDQEQPADDPKPEKNPAQIRIDELTALRRNAERDRDYWRDLALKNQEKPTEPASADPTPPPTMESVGFDEAEYQKAMVAWVDGQVEARFSARDAQAKKEREQQTVAQQQKAFQDRARELAKSKPDYWDVAHSDSTPVSPTMASIIRASDKGPEVLYHLGKNPDLAARMYHMGETEAALEIGRLEARLAMPQPKTTTSAPEPLNTLGGGSGKPTDKDPDDMTTEEWVRWRNKQLGANDGK